MQYTPLSRADANHGFLRVFQGSPNFMTPDVLNRGGLEDENGVGVAWELARGDFMNEPLWGVTVIHRFPERSGWTRTENLSQSFHSINEADAFIATLRPPMICNCEDCQAQDADEGEEGIEPE